MAKLTGMIVALTAVLGAFAGLIDVCGRLISRTEPVTCQLSFLIGLALPWCGPRSKNYNLTVKAKASSSGNDSLKTTKACEASPDGWRFVAGSFRGIPALGNSASAEGGFGDGKPGYQADVKPERVCFDVWADTHEPA
ncbi:hypothetical protein [Bradyrhizobium sp. AZCC 2230]|uniref:hypothetical protein n=1 Tax=Bradyrhizobium sp. AZCC 2230 TaxID=3117021 RepID=UPI002FF1410F